jgi:hypothetical protein
MTFVPQTAPIAGLPPDPFKHVKYTQGMVLGADDFQQEFAFLNGRDQWHMRGVIGYGTICGLRVTVESAGSAGPQVVVAPGTAINPRGQLIRVTSTQCARLNDWLQANQDALLHYAGSPPAGNVRLGVVLCYRECETDQVPIPGEPCRTEDDSMAASRLQDDYLLDLRFKLPEPHPTDDPRFNLPDQRQFDAIRDFVTWLRQIEVDSVADTPALRAAFEDAIRGAVPQLMSPPESPPTSPPDFILSSPPAALVIPADAVCDYLNLAFRLWVTELRPLWLGKNESCAGHPPDEECVLLGEIEFPITAAGQVAVNAPDVVVDENNRPFVLSLQMLQEWMLCGRAGGDGTPGADGASAEMRRQGDEIQWRQSDDDPTWTTLFNLSEIAGTPGADGASAEMRRQGNEIQWRQSDDDPTWTTLFNLSEIAGTPGADGASVELRVDSGFIQWRQSDDDPTWTNLVALADITGPQGDRGPRGATGPAGPPGTNFIVAAGRFNIDGTPVFEFNGMSVQPLGDPRLFYVTYNDFNPRNLVIKGTIINELTNPPHFFEVIEGDRVDQLVEEEIGVGRGEGFVVRVMMANNEIIATGFMIEVSQFPGG